LTLSIPWRRRRPRRPPGPGVERDL